MNHQLSFKTKELRNKMVENATKHVAEYEEATTLYRKAVLAALSEVVNKATNAALIKDDDALAESLTAYLPRPENHSAEYDRVIAMLDMTCDDEITLSEQEFSQYVLDNWSWSHSSLKTLNFYKQSVVK